MKRSMLLFVAISFISHSIAQNQLIELTFTAVENSSYIQLDSIKVINQTQSCDTVLYYPDTVLNLNLPVGISDIVRQQDVFVVFQNYPNPVNEQTTISMFVPEKDKVNFSITNILGEVVLKCNRFLDKGMHYFRFTPPGENLYFFNAQWRGESCSIKILKTTTGPNGRSSLECKSST